MAQWLCTVGQYKTRLVSQSIIDGCVSQTALLLYDEQWATDVLRIGQILPFVVYALMSFPGPNK